MFASVRLRSFCSWCGVAAVVCVALSPWWRNRGYLRDFYDYGLVMAGVGRIAAGERPYSDYTIPIQSGIFLFNGWAEKLGGGTFQAMTVGCAVLIAIATVVLAGTLSRRWPTWAAASVAGAVVCGSLVQHTIIWHNSLGVICLAVAGCASALAPVWRRRDWGWNSLTAVALLARGVEQVEFPPRDAGRRLVLAVARPSSRSRHVAGNADRPSYVAGWGVLAPFAFELLWSGASPAMWWHNVVELASGGRAAYLGSLGELQTYVQPLHDYYGVLVVPFVGAAGLVLTLIVLVVAVPQVLRRGIRRDVVFIVAAAAGSAMAAVALLVTNHEIAYVSLAAWIAMLASLWIGFDLPCGGRTLAACLVLPSVLLGGVFWESAWRGQRSQFGHSAKLRAEYVDAATAGEDFAYLQGTRLPPEFVMSMTAAVEWRSLLPAGQALRIFHGPGLEFLDRIWPAPRVRGQPLWMHVGTSYQPQQARQLARSLLAGGIYDHVLVPIAHEEWPAVVRSALHGGYDARERSLGPIWTLYDRLRAPRSLPKSTFAFMGAFRSNVHVDMFAAENVETYPSTDDGLFLGIDSGRGTLRVRHPSYRFAGEMVVSRPPSVHPALPWKARFEVVRDPGGDGSYVMVSRELELPAGVSQIVEPFAVDGIGKTLDLVVTALSEPVEGCAAGWRAFRLSHAFDGPAAPARFSSRAPEAVALDETALRALLPNGWRPLKAYTRGGRVSAHGFELPPHGELWLWHEKVVSEITGGFSVPTETPWNAPPLVRALGFKGGRIEITSQGYLALEERSFGFRTWSPEAGSWLVLLTDTNDHAPPVVVRIHEAMVTE